MSDHAEGPGWWAASDGQWYPPELHPSASTPSATERSESDTLQTTRAPLKDPTQRRSGGPQFPDLFQKALDGSHLADNVSVKHDGDEGRNEATPASAPGSAADRQRPEAASGGVSGGVSAATITIGAPASSSKRKWRKVRWPTIPGRA